MEVVDHLLPLSRLGVVLRGSWPPVAWAGRGAVRGGVTALGDLPGLQEAVEQVQALHHEPRHLGGGDER